MSRDEALVSIIIPTYQDSKALELCVDALKRQTYPAHSFEVVIVNNDPQRPLHLGNLPEYFRIHEENKPGSYAARNAGLALAQGNIIGFTDADCVPSPNWIETAVRYFNEHPLAQRLAGRIHLTIDDASDSPAALYEKVFSFRQDRYVRDMGTCATANMFSRVAVFHSIGAFNDSYFSGGDMDWGMRANAAGFPIVYVPELVVSHPARSSYADLKKKFRRVGGGKYERTKKSFLLAHRRMIGAFLSPLFNLKQVCIQPNISFSQRCWVLLLRWHLSFVTAWERLKVAYGKPPERS